MQVIAAVPFLTLKSIHPAADISHSIAIAAPLPKTPDRMLLFVDDRYIDVDAIANGGWPEDWPEVDVLIIPVGVGSGKTLDDVVRLFKIEEESSASKEQSEEA